jgi:hypothetical protein
MVKAAKRLASPKKRVKIRMGESPDELFFRLYYREKVSRLAQTLDSHVKTPQFGVMPMTEVVDALSRFVREAEDEDMCHDMCKNMYFCTRKKGHRGRHSENEMLFWD